MADSPSKKKPISINHSSLKVENNNADRYRTDKTASGIPDEVRRTRSVDCDYSKLFAIAITE